MRRPRDLVWGIGLMASLVFAAPIATVAAATSAKGTTAGPRVVRDGSVETFTQGRALRYIPAYAILAPKADLGGYTDPMPPNPIMGEFIFPPLLWPGLEDLRVGMYDFDGVLMLSLGQPDWPVDSATISSDGATSVTLGSPGALTMTWSIPSGTDSVSGSAPLPVPWHAILLADVPVNGGTGAVYAAFYEKEFILTGEARFSALQDGTVRNYVGTVTMTVNEDQAALPSAAFYDLEDIVRADTRLLVYN